MIASFPPHTDSAIIQEEWDQFYLLIGEALTSWTRMEGRLRGLFNTMLMRDGPNVQIYYLFSGIVAFEQKVKILDLAFSGCPGARDREDLSDEWRALKKELRKKKDFRNKLAHGVVSNLGTVGRDAKIYVCFLPFPWANDVPVIDANLKQIDLGKEPSPRIPPDYAVGQSDIKHFMEQVKLIENRVQKLEFAIYEHMKK